MRVFETYRDSPLFSEETRPLQSPISAELVPTTAQTHVTTPKAREKCPALQ